MSSLIDDLKKQDAQQQEATANLNAIRLHNAGVVRAKAPDLWTLLIAEIDTILTQLREAFPSDLSRHGDLTSGGDSFTIQGKKLPISIMKLTLNLGGTCINVHQALKRDFGEHPKLMPNKPIDFIVTRYEDVVFFWKDRTYTDPAALAEQLIKLACRLH